MTLKKDLDPIETQEWLDAFASLVKYEGKERAQFILDTLLASAYKKNISLDHQAFISPYCNTIPVSEEPAYPGDLNLEKSIEALIRWNAIVMVLRAKKEAGGVG